MRESQQASILETLSRVPLFAMLGPADLREIARMSRVQHLSAGEGIVSPGEAADRFFVILSGRVKVYQLSARGDEQILHIYGGGATFGEAAMWGAGTYPAHADAAAKGEVLVVTREALGRLIGRRPELAMAMLAGLSRKLQEFTRLIESLSLKEVPARLAAAILELAREQQSGSIELAESKRELAARLGTIAETLSRALARLKAEGLIAVSGRRITILDAAGLARKADS